MAETRTAIAAVFFKMNFRGEQPIWGKAMSNKFTEQMKDTVADLVVEAADLVKPHQAGDIQAFARRLCGLEGLDFQAMRERLAGVEIPGDFRHFRFHNLARNIPWGASYSQEQEQITLDQVLLFVCCLLPRSDLTPTGPGVWTGTEALPIRDPGVLELGLMFRPLH